MNRKAEKEGVKESECFTSSTLRLNSGLLYKLDPRTKLLLALFFTLLVFVVDELPAAAAMVLIFTCLWFAAKMPIQKFLTSLKWVSGLIVFIAVLQILFGPGDRFILKPLVPEPVPFIGGMGSLKWDGLFLALVIGCRVAALVLILPMLTITTSPYLLALALTRLGLPYRAAFITTAALNMVPAFEEEARFIMDAQKLRGLRVFEEGKLPDKLKSYPALAVPLIINAMRRAQLMGIAMDSRAFGAGRDRTWLENIKMSAHDYWAFAAGLVFSASIAVLNFALKQG